MTIIKSLIGLITPVLSFNKMDSLGYGEKLSDLKGFLRDLLECPVCFATIKSVTLCLFINVRMDISQVARIVFQNWTNVLFVGMQISRFGIYNLKK